MKKLSLGLALLTLTLTTNAQEGIGMEAGKLKPCPDSPNCISSMEDRKRKQVDPIQYSSDMSTAKENIKRTMASFDSQLVDSTGSWYHYTVTTRIGNFTDDVQFYFPTDSTVIHIKSASREGYGDMGANSRRVRKIRRRFQEWE